MNAGDAVMVRWMGHWEEAVLEKQVWSGRKQVWRVRIPGVPHTPMYDEPEMVASATSGSAAVPEVGSFSPVVEQPPGGQGAGDESEIRRSGDGQAC